MTERLSIVGRSSTEFWGTADLIAEGDHVVGLWESGDTKTGDAFRDIPIGALPASTGRTMRFTGTTILEVENGQITEEVDLDDGVAGPAARLDPEQLTDRTMA